MLGLVESVIAELLSIGPELFLILGTPELPKHRRFVTVRQGGQTRLVRV